MCLCTKLPQTKSQKIPFKICAQIFVIFRRNAGLSLDLGTFFMLKQLV